MGEVRVTVKLTNGADDALFRLDQLSSEKVRQAQAVALVDTGAVRTIVPSQK